MNVVGIDPGFKGAIAVVGTEIEPQVWDLPVTGHGRRGEFDLERLAYAIHHVSLVNQPDTWYLEWPTTRPDESAESSKRFGVGLGLLEGMIYAYSTLRPVRLSPNKWKGQLGLRGKEGREQEAREEVVVAARDLLGISGERLRGPRGAPLDGRAEALLIAWWGLTGTLEGLRSQPEDTRLLRLLAGGRSAKRRFRGGGGGAPLV